MRHTAALLFLLAACTSASTDDKQLDSEPADSEPADSEPAVDSDDSEPNVDSEPTDSEPPDDTGPREDTDPPDNDGDAVPDATDNCAALPNPTQLDLDNDGSGDACDNCPLTANASQANLDGDLWGDPCDPEVDVTTFEKPDNADWTDPAFHDCLTPSLCVSRMATGQLITVGTDDLGGPIPSAAPTGLSFVAGTAGQDLPWDTLRNTWDGGSTVVYRPFALQVDGTSQVENVLFTRWGSAVGGAFAWGRAPTTHFDKPAYADFTQPQLQDCLGPNVCLTRGDNQSLFNIAQEAAYASTSPAGTEWAPMRTLDATPADYAPFTQAVSNNPSAAVGQVLSLHLLGTDLYYDVVLTAFSGGNTGGAVAWTRSRALVAGCIDPTAANFDPRATVDHGYCGDWQLFHRPTAVDPTDPAHWDCLTPTVCLSRDATDQLYNASTEAAGNLVLSDSPAGTTWTTGFTSDPAVDTTSYGTWLEKFGSNPTSLVNTPLSMHAVDDDLWFDVVLTKWAGAGLGGGFAWVRRPAPPPAVP